MSINGINKVDSARGVSGVVKYASFSSQPVAEPTQQPSKAELEAAISKLNAMMTQSNTAVEFSLDSSSNSPVIKVIDKETKSVLRQLPNVEALAFSKNLETFKGILLNQKA
jgi:flagellar protein FlaG